MKKWLIIGGCLGIIYLLIRPWPEPTMLEIVEGYEESWGIALPEPQRFEQIWATKNPARGDGEWVSVLHYEEALPEPTSADYNLITADNEAVIAGKVTRFMTNTIDTHLGNKETQAEIRAAFQKHPVEFELGDYYFHQVKNDGDDYIIGIYSRAHNKIYLLEWHQ
ncbi:MAG: hypothetical protein ABS942_07815 [Solibacillus sp.]